MVPLGLFLTGQRLADQGYGIVARAEARRARPFKHRGNPLPHIPRGRCLDVPDGGEDFQNVGSSDIANRHVSDDGEGVIPQGVDPLIDMLAVAPTLRPLPVHLLGRILKGRHAWHGKALLLIGDRVDAAIGFGAIDCGHLARFGERDFMQGAQAEITALAVNGEAQGLALAAVGVDLEIEAAAIAMPARRCKMFDSRDRETVEALRLSFPHVRRCQKWGRGFDPIFYPMFFPTAMRVLSGYVGC